MIVEFPRGRVRHASEPDAVPQVPRLAPGAAVLIMLLLSLALWALVAVLL